MGHGQACSGGEYCIMHVHPALRGATTTTFPYLGPPAPVAWSMQICGRVRAPVRPFATSAVSGNAIKSPSIGARGCRCRTCQRTCTWPTSDRPSRVLGPLLHSVADTPVSIPCNSISSCRLLPSALTDRQVDRLTEDPAPADGTQPRARRHTK